MMRIFYNFILTAAGLAALPLVLCRAGFSAERRETIRRRLAISPLPGPAVPKPRGKRRIWVHALSVGETQAAIPLVHALAGRYPEAGIVFSAATRTGFETARSLLGQTVETVRYFPYDFIFSVRRAARDVEPDLLILVESDIWPNFLFEMKNRGVPALLVNARLSDRSFRGHRRLGAFSRTLFSLFSRICTQSPADSERFRRLGIPGERVVETGSLKFDAEIRPIDGAEIDRLKGSLGIRPDRRVIVAGSTHRGEEAILSSAFARLKKEFPDLLLIVVPRDPARAPEVRGIFGSAGLEALLLGETATSRYRKRDVIVGDTIGFLRRLYALADLAFVGGSLVRCGGHNPLEPAALGKPILFGPHMSDFRHAARLLVSGGGAFRTDSGEDLLRTAGTLIRDREKALRAGRESLSVFLAHRGALERTVAVIDPFLSGEKR